jgi:hypothetical protein
MKDLMHLNILFGMIKDDLKLIKLEMSANIKTK